MQLCSHSAVEWIHKSRRNPFIITAKWEPWRKNKPGLFICLPISPALVQLQQGINPLLQKQNTWNASVLYDFIILPSYRLLNSKKKAFFFFWIMKALSTLLKKKIKSDWNMHLNCITQQVWVQVFFIIKVCCLKSQLQKQANFYWCIR